MQKTSTRQYSKKNKLKSQQSVKSKIFYNFPVPVLAGITKIDDPFLSSNRNFTFYSFLSTKLPLIMKR